MSRRNTGARFWITTTLAKHSEARAALENHQAAPARDPEPDSLF